MSVEPDSPLSRTFEGGSADSRPRDQLDGSHQVVPPSRFYREFHAKAMGGPLEIVARYPVRLNQFKALAQVLTVFILKTILGLSSPA